MADLKISQLPAYPAILSGANDAFVIVDSTNTASKKISPQALVGAFLLTGNVVPSATPVVSPAIYQNIADETTWIYDGTQWVQISSGGAFGGSFAPYLSFTGSATASAGQTFTSSIFTQYPATSDATVSINGVILTPGVSYSISGTVLTILDYLAPNALVEVAAKALPNSSVVTNLVTQGDDLFTTQAGDFIIIN